MVSAIHLVAFDKLCRPSEESLIQADFTGPCTYAPHIPWLHRPQKGPFERHARLGTFLEYQKEQFFIPKV